MPETWGRHPAVLWRQTDAAVVLLREGSSDTVLLNGTGADLWSALDRPTQVDDLAAHLANRYQADGRQVRDDLVATLQDLEGRGLVVRGCA